MAEFFGELERIAADLYPYRWPIMAGLVLVLAGVIITGLRKAWHLLIYQHRVKVAIFGTPVLVLAGYMAYDLGSPLFISKTVEEEFPFAFSSILPSNMSMSEAEEIMAGVSKLNLVVEEKMPEMMKKVSTVATIAKDQVSGTATPTPKVVTATVAPAPEPTAAPEAESLALKLKSGEFEDADSFHKGSGIATIYRGPDGSHLLRLEELSVTNGPDLHVILSPHQNPEKRADVTAAGYVDLGKLKGNKGNQNYDIPGDVDIAAQGSVVIYCVPFHVVFSVATLQEAS